MMDSTPVIGIDFGTTNSVCATMEGNQVHVLRNEQDKMITPSVAYYTQDSEQNRPLIGDPALNKAEEHPDRVIRSIKRDLGDEDEIHVADETYRVEEVAGDIIRKIRTDAARALDISRSELTEAVITTPAYWESDRTQAVRQAGKLAGFERVETIKEPAAAAIAYSRYRPEVKKQIAVYDLGGGTFDFAIVDVDTSRNRGDEYEVLAQSGNPQLGGDDWDQRVAEWIIERVKVKHGVNPVEPHDNDDVPHEWRQRQERIYATAKDAKERLSEQYNDRVDIQIPFLMEAENGIISVDLTLSRAKFDELTRDLVEQTLDPITTAFSDAGLEYQDIDDVVLVGGSTKMPQVKDFVNETFRMSPKSDIEQDTVVAKGAAVKASRDDLLLLEVAPLSLGIGIKGDRFERMIERNDRLPARTTKTYRPASEGSTAVRIPIYQGERDIASENRHLKTLVITGMVPGQRNSAHVEVTFEVQKNGVINVRAIENTTNKSVDAQIEDENALPDEYIANKIKEAREMEERDRKRRKVIEAQNEAEQAIKEANRILENFNHVLDEICSPNDVKDLKRHIRNVEKKRDDPTTTLGDLRTAVENLNQWTKEIGDKVRRHNPEPSSSLPKASGIELEDSDDDDEQQSETDKQLKGVVASTPSSQTSASTTSSKTNNVESQGENDTSTEPDKNNNVAQHGSIDLDEYDSATIVDTEDKQQDQQAQRDDENQPIQEEKRDTTIPTAEPSNTEGEPMDRDINSSTTKPKLSEAINLNQDEDDTDTLSEDDAGGDPEDDKDAELEKNSKKEKERNTDKADTNDTQDDNNSSSQSEVQQTSSTSDDVVIEPNTEDTLSQSVADIDTPEEKLEQNAEEPQTGVEEPKDDETLKENDINDMQEETQDAVTGSLNDPDTYNSDNGKSDYTDTSIDSQNDDNEDSEDSESIEGNENNEDSGSNDELINIDEIESGFEDLVTQEKQDQVEETDKIDQEESDDSDQIENEVYIDDTRKKQDDIIDIDPNKGKSSYSSQNEKTDRNEEYDRSEE